jgi:hypothetical protein
MPTPKIRKSMDLENEIIVSVVILYLVISLALVAVHYLQPKGQETKTSSPSPSHSDFRSDDAKNQ